MGLITDKGTPIGRLVAAGVAVDSWLFHAAYNRRGPRLSALIMWLFTKSGDGPLYMALCLGLLATDAPRARELSLVAAVAFGIERTLYLVLKRAFRRARPYAKFQHVRSTIKPLDRYSFPSGHAAAACVMATLVSLFYPAFAGIAWAWAVGVAYSRVYHGVHFPADVAAGLVLGHVCARLGLVAVM